MTRRKVNKTTSTSSKTTQQPMMLDFSKLATLVLDDLNKTRKSQVFFNTYTKENVIDYLSRPQQYSKQLREMSNFLYITSSHYRRLINYFAKLYLLDYVIEPYYINTENLNERTFKKTYSDICLNVENMNLKHELLKAQVCAWRDDIFYGYIHQTKDSFYIQKLDPNYCQVSSMVDGCYIYSFDFSFFNGKDESTFDQYPEEFIGLYQQYKQNAQNKWIEINIDNCFCIKANEDIDYPLVPFCGVFDALYDIEDYKSLKKAKTAIGNYKLLAMVMPLAKEGTSTNEYLIDPDEVTKYYNFMSSMLPDSIGLLLSPTQLQSFDFDNDKSDTDKVQESTSQFWDSAGVSELLMTGRNGSTGASLAKSVVTDEALSFGLVKQIERNINRLLKKYNSDTYKFRLRFLPTTIFNWQDVYDKYRDASSFGFPTKLLTAAALGISPNGVNNMLYLENTILELPDNMIPTSSSYTQSDKSSGRPTVADDKKSDAGIATDETDGNNKDSRGYELDLDKVIE